MALYFRLEAFDCCKGEVQMMQGEVFPPDYRVSIYIQPGNFYDADPSDLSKPLKKKVAIFAKSEVDEYHVFGKVKIYRFERIEER